MTTFTLRFDEQTKSSLDELCDSLGMNLTTFFNIYIKKSLREQRIPFDVNNDPFYSERNQKALDESFEQDKRGEVITMTIDEFKRLCLETDKPHKSSGR